MLLSLSIRVDNNFLFYRLIQGLYRGFIDKLLLAMIDGIGLELCKLKVLEEILLCQYICQKNFEVIS